MAKQYKGTINLDIRNSVPDWEAFRPPVARPGAPNILYIVWDDTGFGAWDTFGGMIETPNMTRIAQQGLKFTNWHTTALCSPTRACLLTGRNAHTNGMACITEAAQGFPGLSGVIPPESGMLSEVLVEEGYATFCLGKWHLTPSTESDMSSSRRTWPLSRGFERFYGFLGGETNQYYPDLVYDNHLVDAPAGPEHGYHLSKDLADRALEFIRDLKQVAPDKPWLCYFAPGANHAPHHVPREWADRYRGRFDMGYERYREMTLENMKRMGIVAANTQLSPINPWPAPDVIPPADVVRPWDSLSDEQKRLYSRMAEVYAGFCSYTDDQIGRILDYLEASGQLDNTIVVAVSDNGASGEGGPDGSTNENKFFNGWPDDLQENLAALEDLGSPQTYNHYPTGWAWAFDTPNKMFKRYSLEGGIADPCIIAWPGQMRDVAGGIRDQYHHAIDIVPTLLELAAVEAPPLIKGHAQLPVEGTSMAYTFGSPDAPTHRRTQYYAMLGTRAIYHRGWKAVARHGALLGKGHFMDDEWELYHIEEDRSEMFNLAEHEPEKLKELIATWFAVAGRYNVFPLDDRTALEILTADTTRATAPATDTYVYYPDTAPVPEAAGPNIRNRSFAVSAAVNIQSPETAGVLFSQGTRFGGHVLLVKDQRLHYVYNFLGIEEQHISAGEPLSSGPQVLGADFTKEGEEPRGVAFGTLRLYMNDRVVAEGRIRTQPGSFGLGAFITIGRSSSDAVAGDLMGSSYFSGGSIDHIAVHTRGAHYVDVEKEALAAMARD
ncbi:MAG: arylsulfatase [Dehalococcoidia bacterium]